VLPVEKKDGLVYVQVESSTEAAGYIAANFFEQPSERLKVVGVTGTNGKTTIATLLYKLFTSLGYTADCYTWKIVLAKNFSIPYHRILLA
jgi:UDP-N-acetylmuramoyl-L-alanyl-D-glutamate--2,6-diaminopimelate ligase